MVDITINSAFAEVFSILISLITNAGSLINDLGRLGIALINILLSVFGAKIPDVIVIANLEISTGLFVNLLVFGGALYVIWTKFSEMFKTYMKIILTGGGCLLVLSVIGAVL